MGLDNDMLPDISPIIVDIETAGLPNAADFLEPIPDAVPDESPIEVDKRLTDASKIVADLDKKRAARIEQNREAQAKVEAQRIARLERAALDWNVGRIVALGWWTEHNGELYAACRTEDEERRLLGGFWATARHRTIVGFNVKGFDLKFMIQRSRYLGVPHPLLDLGKYTRKGIVDLFSELTFNDGTYDQGAMRRTLHAFCRRFGISVEDTTTGKDIAALVAAGDWDAIEAHVRSDVGLTVALGCKLGVIQFAPVPEAAAVA